MEIENPMLILHAPRGQLAMAGMLSFVIYIYDRFEDPKESDPSEASSLPVGSAAQKQWKFCFSRPSAPPTSYRAESRHLLLAVCYFCSVERPLAPV